jgi:hypothetical protein
LYSIVISPETEADPNSVNEFDIPVRPKSRVNNGQSSATASNRNGFLTLRQRSPSTDSARRDGRSQEESYSTQAVHPNLSRTFPQVVIHQRPSASSQAQAKASASSSIKQEEESTVANPADSDKAKSHTGSGDRTDDTGHTQDALRRSARVLASKRQRGPGSGPDSSCKRRKPNINAAFENIGMPAATKLKDFLATFWSDQLVEPEPQLSPDEARNYDSIYATISQSIIRNTGPESTERSSVKTLSVN